MNLLKDQFLKDFWGKTDQVKVDAEALKKDLQTIERQSKEIEALKTENTRLQAQVIHYRTNFMALQAKEPIYVDLRG